MTSQPPSARSSPPRPPTPARSRSSGPPPWTRASHRRRSSTPSSPPRTRAPPRRPRSSAASSPVSPAPAATAPRPPTHAWSPGASFRTPSHAPSCSSPRRGTRRPRTRWPCSTRCGARGATRTRRCTTS
uniref:Uncharacterized protein n=1 Tax=Arundo donax TaxID=35708 RepID=A0A0A9DC21_ARUDO